MKHKAGIIGYGNMGSWHVENVNSRIDNIDFVACYDIEAERCELAAKAGLKVCATPEELLGEDIDLVLVATPNNFHKPYAIMAMKAGKNVVCEKPACLNSEELEEIIKVSEETGNISFVKGGAVTPIQNINELKLLLNTSLGE